MNKNAFEKLMWSIALPGFGQYLNGKYFKGTVLLILEFLINVQANFNQVILLSFHGEIGEAIDHARLPVVDVLSLFVLFFYLGCSERFRWRERPLLFPSLCVFCLFCNCWIDFFIKLNDIWRVIGSCLAPNVVCFSWGNNRSFY